MRWNVIAIQLQQFRSVFGKKIGDIIGSVPFALSSNSALIFNVNIGILSEIQNDLKKKHTIVMQHETQRLSGPF